MCEMSFCEIWHLFSQALIRNILWCYYRWLTTCIALVKCKRNAVLFKLFWHKVFVHWKLKLLNCLMSSILNVFTRNEPCKQWLIASCNHTHLEWQNTDMFYYLSHGTRSKGCQHFICFYSEVEFLEGKFVYGRIYWLLKDSLTSIACTVSGDIVYRVLVM